jgi:tetratricopeptide (TPR) repeat protein
MATRNGDYRGAFRIVEQFLSAHPNHVIALETLVDIGVDAGFDVELQSAQMRLAAACLHAGRYRQAWEAAADLVVRHPQDQSYRDLLVRIDRIGRAQGLALPPIPEAEPEPEAAATVVQPRPVAVPPPPSAPPPVAEPLPVAEPPQVAEAPRVAAAAQQPVAEHAVSDAGVTGDELLREWLDTELAFENIRNGLLDDAAAAAEERMSEASRLIEAHRLDEAIQALEEAMCAPHLRTSAGAKLAQIHRASDAPLDALACLEWVAQVPPATEENGHELAYELAVTLESLGQEAQALGVYRELVAEVGPGYRDIASRLERLAAA